MDAASPSTAPSQPPLKHPTPKPWRARFNPLLAALAFALLWLLHRTYRVRVHGALPDQTPLLLAFWHGEQQMILPARPRGVPLAILTSPSLDGQLQANILKRFQIEPVQGSSSRQGASGLLALTRKLQGGMSVALAVDGPRGPRHVPKPGMGQLSRAAAVPVVPIRARAAPALTFKRAWDKLVLPLPWARLDLYILPALPPPASRAEVAAYPSRLRLALGSEVPVSSADDTPPRAPPPAAMTPMSET